MADYRPVARLTLAMMLLAMGCTHPIKPTTGTHAGAGEAAAQALQARYDDTRPRCGAPSEGAFLCSGLLARARPENGEPWSVSPAEQAKGAMVAGYFRQDTQASRLPNGAFSAIVYYPILAEPTPMTDYEVLCASPTPSDPLQRKLKGCGEHPLGGTVSAQCSDRTPPLLGAEAWAVEYRNIRPPDQRPYRLCSFDVSDDRNELGVEAFLQFTRVGGVLRQAGEPFPAAGNVVMLTLMPSADKAKLPVEAFIYDATFSAGVAEAGAMQQVFHQATGLWRPVIRVRMPFSYEDHATFTYRPEDQRVMEP